MATAKFIRKGGKLVNANVQPAQAKVPAKGYTMKKASMGSGPTSYRDLTPPCVFKYDTVRVSERFVEAMGIFERSKHCKGHAPLTADKLYRIADAMRDSLLWARERSRPCHWDGILSLLVVEMAKRFEFGGVLGKQLQEVVNVWNS